MANIREINGKKQDKGTYILLAKLAKTQTIKPGKLPEAEYKKGIYLYVGRARTGLKARVKRHIRSEKKLYWHIDYLLQKAKVVDIWIRQDYFDECNTADEIRNFKPATAKAIQGFGSSDCHCRSHLFYFPSEIKAFRTLRNNMEFKKVEIDGNTF